MAANTAQMGSRDVHALGGGSGAPQTKALNFRLHARYARTWQRSRLCAQIGSCGAHHTLAIFRSPL